jgi:ribosomal protein L25 (general stress protein Ctc)
MKKIRFLAVLLLFLLFSQTLNGFFVSQQIETKSIVYQTSSGDSEIIVYDNGEVLKNINVLGHSFNFILKKLKNNIIINIPLTGERFLFLNKKINERINNFIFQLNLINYLKIVYLGFILLVFVYLKTYEQFFDYLKGLILSKIKAIEYCKKIIISVIKKNLYFSKSLYF